MKRLSVLTGMLCAVVLVGCGTTTYPTTGAEFKQATASSSLLDRESFEVNRPFAQVARALQRKSAECLNYKLDIAIRPVGVIGGSTKILHEQAKSTVAVTDSKAELTFQVKHTGEPAQHPYKDKEPPDGVIYLVADVYPAGKGRTKIDIVRARVAVVAEAIKAWAGGNDKGCPDPARVYPR
jgi:hypothetical protein